MKKASILLGYLIILTSCCNFLFGQEIRYTLLNNTKTTYTDCDGKIANRHYNQPPYNANIEKTETRIEMIGDTSIYWIELFQAREIDNNSCPDYKSYGPRKNKSYNIIRLYKEEAKMFKELVLKYFEWYYLAKTKGLLLTKEMYSSSKHEQLDCCEYGQLKLGNGFLMHPLIRENGEIIKTRRNCSLKVTFMENELEFNGYGKITNYSGEYKGYSFNSIISLSYNDLKIIKVLIENGTYDKYLKKLKDLNKTWDEFKRF